MCQDEEHLGTLCFISHNLFRLRFLKRFFGFYRFSEFLADRKVKVELPVLDELSSVCLLRMYCG